MPGEHTRRTEEDIIERQVAFSDVKITFLGLYRYASVLDVLLLIVYAICALGAGACQPIPALIFSRIAYIFVQYENQPAENESSASHDINHYTLYFLYLAIGSFVTQYIATAGFTYTGAKLTRRIKERCMESILKQNVAFFDQRGIGEVANQITSDVNMIQDGLSQKLSLTLSAVGTLVATFIISFIAQWKITLMLIWVILVGAGLLFGGNKVAVRYSTRALEAYSAGSCLVEEALGAIRYTTALGMQKDVADRYEEQLVAAEKEGFLLKSFMGSMVGFAIGTGYINVALAFWQGSRYLSLGEASFTAVVTIILCIKSAAFSVLGAGANTGAFVGAVAAGSRVLSLVDRVSPIDSSSDDGVMLSEDTTGKIEFRDIKHIYPSQPSVVVTENLNLTFEPGKTTAIVGVSGAGKSTIAQLLERFYEPVNGNIFLDDRDIWDINLKSLRRTIRLVNREPVLFDTTILENISYGLTGSKNENCSPDEKQRLVEEAAKLACAHGFIQDLPSGYFTIVGERGSNLSGGQKQRISIARALIANPKVLLLDEATSALDTKTELHVQKALKESTGKRTTIIIARRPSTIRNADHIVVLEKGNVVEQGTHDHLIAAEGAYHRLLQAQATDTTLEASFNKEEITEKRSENWLSNEKGQVAVEETASSIQSGRDQDEQPERNSFVALTRFVAVLNLSELHIIAVGLACSMVAGFEEPASAILFGKAIAAISLPLSKGDLIRDHAGFWAYMFVALALVVCLVFIIQGIAFAYCSERLVFQARRQALAAMLRQEMSYFDRKENSADALTAFLSVESNDLAGISGATLGTILIATSTLISAFVVGVVFGWKLGLVCSAVIPVLVGSGFYGVVLVGKLQEQIDDANRESTMYAEEAVLAIQTVLSLAREDKVLSHFKDSISVSVRECLRTSLQTSALYALSQSLLYACMGLGFWYGGTLIINHEYSIFQFVTVYFSVIMGAFSAGLVFSFAPDIGRARNSAQSYKVLLGRKSRINPEDTSRADVQMLEGKIEFRNVSFEYPSRPRQLALSNVSFSVEPGQHVAIVGETGSGKSTIVSLLERFYDPSQGQILVDGTPIVSLNVATYRKCLGLVMQEPVLYDSTIRENLLFGLDRASITNGMIESACKDANIYNFILSLPDGFSTVVSNRGSQLSSGQKKRMALARALLQCPSILLIDEATSGVDAESEDLIQKALESVMKDRTTINAAHRLSTIRNAHLIIVMDHGQVIEMGSHDELWAREGKYRQLYEASA